MPIILVIATPTLIRSFAVSKMILDKRITAVRIIPIVALVLPGETIQLDLDATQIVGKLTIVSGNTKKRIRQPPECFVELEFSCTIKSGMGRAIGRRQ